MNTNNIIDVIQNKIGRSLGIDEIIKVSSIYKKLEIKRKKVFNNEEINKLANFLIEELFINDMFNLLHKYMNDELNKSDNSTYLADTQKIKQISKQLDLNINQAINKVSHTLEKNILFPNYVRQYVVLDNLYQDWNVSSIINYNPLDIPLLGNGLNGIKDELSWYLSSLLQSSQTNETYSKTILLKYPLKNIIGIQLLGFNISYYLKYTGDVGIIPGFSPYKLSGWNYYTLVLTPPQKMIKINISEIKEKFYSSNQELYTILANTQYDNEYYNNNSDKSFITKVKPINNGIIQFRYPIQEITKLSFSFNDFNIDKKNMILLSPLYYSDIIISIGAITYIFIPYYSAFNGVVLNVGEHIYLSNFTTTPSPIGGSPEDLVLKELNRKSGWKIFNILLGPIDSQIIQIALDTSILGPFNIQQPLKSTVYIPSRRIQIPMIFTQLRDYT